MGTRVQIRGWKPTTLQELIESGQRVIEQKDEPGKVRTNVDIQWSEVPRFLGNLLNIIDPTGMGSIGPGGFIKFVTAPEVATRFGPKAISTVTDITEEVSSMLPAIAEASKDTGLKFMNPIKEMMLAGYARKPDIFVWFKSPKELVGIRQRGGLPAEASLKDIIEGIIKHESWGHLGAQKVPAIGKVKEVGYSLVDPSTESYLRQVIDRLDLPSATATPAGEFIAGFAELFNPKDPYAIGKGISAVGRRVEKWARENPESYRKLASMYMEAAHSTPLATTSELIKGTEPSLYFLEELKGMPPIRSGHGKHITSKTVPIRGRFETGPSIIRSEAKELPKESLSKAEQIAQERRSKIREIIREKGRYKTKGEWFRAMRKKYGKELTNLALEELKK